jgi:hypothetical protein
MALRALVSLAVLSFLATGCGGGDSDSGVLPGVNALVFVKRAYIRGDGTQDVNGGTRQTIDYQRYTPGGGVFVLEPPTPNGTLRNLTAGFAEVDVNGLDVSFDARQVTFSMRREGDDHYHIYVANVDGSGEVQQLTFGEKDDINPIYVPGDRIAFLTNEPYTAMGTRADEYEHAREVVQLATISAATGDADRRVCSQNLSHTTDPFLMADGRIGFSRWEHLGPINDVKLFAMNPDCTQMVALAGQHGKPGNSIVQATEVSEGRYVGIVTSRSRTLQSGGLYMVDARSTGGSSQIGLNEQEARFTALTPDVPTDQTSPASGVGRYRYPMPIPGRDELIVSWSDGDVNDRNELAETAPNFGIYMFDPETRRRTLVYDDPNSWDLYALPVAARTIPPVHPGVIGPAPDPTQPAVIGSVDITVTSLTDLVRGGTLDGMPLGDALDHAVAVRVIEGFSSEIGPVREFGLTMHEGAAIVGEAPVYADGSWEAQVPSRIPYHLQPIDEFGMSIRNQMTWIQAMPGEARRCGGCHEARNETVLPRMGSTTLAQQAGPVDFDLPIPDRIELPWAGATTGTNVGDVIQARCASCHDGGGNDPYAGRFYTVDVTTMDGDQLTYQIPYLRLTNEPIEVYYENDVHTYPMSYVTLLYPSAMMGDSVATGDVPPEWVIPGAARESRLISGINVESTTTPGRWAFDDVHGNGALDAVTPEERQMLIRMADLGGQYWSRRNVQGSTNWGSVEY